MVSTVNDQCLTKHRKHRALNICNLHTCNVRLTQQKYTSWVNKTETIFINSNSQRLLILLVSPYNPVPLSGLGVSSLFCDSYYTRILHTATIFYNLYNILGYHTCILGYHTCSQQFLHISTWITRDVEIKKHWYFLKDEQFSARNE